MIVTEILDLEQKDVDTSIHLAIMNQIIGQRTQVHGGKPLLVWENIQNLQGSGRSAGTYTITATGGSATKAAKFRVNTVF